MDQAEAPVNPGPAPAATAYYTVFWDEQARCVFMRHRLTGELVIPAAPSFNIINIIIGFS